MLLMIDNYDSFTYILVQYFITLGEEVIVRRNDEVTLNDIEALRPDAIIISPGPCSPNEAGISNDVLRHFAGRLPILGVCLGMQCMAASFKGEVIRAPAVMHGKTSLINHNNQGMFKNLANPLRVARYHSLVINPDKIPENFEITAWINEDTHHQPIIMGIKHREFAIEGVQFHPESFLTQQGQELLDNFIHTYL